MGRCSRMINSEPKIAGSASQHVKSNFLSALVSDKNKYICEIKPLTWTMIGMYCIQDTSWIAASK